MFYKINYKYDTTEKFVGVSSQKMADGTWVSVDKSSLVLNTYKESKLYSCMKSNVEELFTARFKRDYPEAQDFTIESIEKISITTLQ